MDDDRGDDHDELIVLEPPVPATPSWLRRAFAVVLLYGPVSAGVFSICFYAVSTGDWLYLARHAWLIALLIYLQLQTHRAYRWGFVRGLATGGASLVLTKRKPPFELLSREERLLDHVMGFLQHLAEHSRVSYHVDQVAALSQSMPKVQKIKVPDDLSGLQPPPDEGKR